MINFISTIKGLEDIEECLPRPSKSFIPSWWKNLDSSDPISIKRCPSFPDFFSQGFVIPMWSDVTFSFDKEKDYWNARGESGSPEWVNHSNKQFVDHVTPSFMNMDADIVFKAICPWRIITDPGYSVLQIPLFYHFNKQWSVMPGVIDTDIYHEINQQVLYHGDGQDVTIKKGDPFVMYIPFKREKNDYSIRHQTSQDIQTLINSKNKMNGYSLGDGAYRKMQRDRDKNVR